MVDAAVSGAQRGAQEADLVFMVGGSPESVARVAPILSILGRVHFHVGPLSSGHVMKCINNTITALTFLATAERLALGKPDRGESISEIARWVEQQMSTEIR